MSGERKAGDAVRQMHAPGSAQVEAVVGAERVRAHRRILPIHHHLQLQPVLRRLQRRLIRHRVLRAVGDEVGARLCWAPQELREEV